MQWLWDLFSNRKQSSRTPHRDDTPSIARPSAAAPSAAAGSVPVAPVAAPSAQPRYGIVKAIELMRDLPLDKDADVMLRVLRKTLESTDVHLSDLVEDATKRERTLEQDMSSELAAIAALEREIATRTATVTRIEKDLAETKRARERLETASSNRTQARPAFTVPDAGAGAEAAPLPKPPSTPPPVPASKGDGPPPLPPTISTSTAADVLAKDERSAGAALDVSTPRRDSERPTMHVLASELESVPPPPADKRTEITD